MAVARSLADQVVEPLFMRIAAGHLAPGVNLPAQRDLAKELGVGLPVLREAMPRLQSPRVRKACHGRGDGRSGPWQEPAAVRTIAEPARARGPHLEPALEARYAIEKGTVRMAAVRATEDDLLANG